MRSTLPLLTVLLLAHDALAARAVVLQDNQSTYPLGLALEILEDKEGRWTIADVTSTEISRRFKPNKISSPTFGLTRSAYWVRFSVQSAISGPADWLLEVAYPMHDRVSLFIPTSTGAYDEKITGDTLPFETREVDHRNFVFRLPLKPKGESTFYMRFESEGVMTLPLILWNASAFVDNEIQESYSFGLYYGLLITMALYNLFVYFFIRDRSYLHLVLAILSFALLQASLNGLAFQYLWPSFIWFGARAVPIFANLFFVFIISFSMSTLSTVRYAPRLDRILFLLRLFSGVWLPLSFLLGYKILITQVSLTAQVSAVCMVITGIRCWQKGNAAARYFMVAWTIFFLGAFIYTARIYEILPHTFLTLYGMQIGSALAVVLLSISLADRINILKHETERAQAAALEVQKQAAVRLEEEVQHKTQDLRQQTRELERAYERLAEQDRLKSQFFANVSHELRTPLTLILTPLARLLESEEGLRPAAKDRLRSMVGNTQRLLRLVNQLLDLSRLESGATTVDYEQLDIRAQVEPIVRSFEPFARGKGLRLEIRGPDELPRVTWDPNHLDKVLSNLLSNACKFTGPGGTVVIRLDSNATSLRIAVKDTGIGIAKEDLSKIFERFRQLDGDATRQHEGTGIGLALSKELVELTGGELEVESEPGVGSTFTVTLPLGEDHIPESSQIRAAEQDTRDPGRVESAAAALAAEVSLQAPLAGKDASADRSERPDSRPLLLVVEDNPDMRSLVTEICEAEFRVLEAEDGAQGLALIRKHRPALVISDIMMPKMDGYELLKQVRSEPSTRSIPVILLTAKVGPEMRLEGLEIGADDYITKPFEPREMLARARNLVRLQQQEREMRELTISLQQQVVQQAAELERARMLGRYLSPALVHSVLEQGEPVLVSQQRLRLTAFCIELRGVDALAEVTEPEDMVAMLNGYLSTMMEQAFAHGATVDTLVQDRVGGFFGAPASDGPEQDAIRCAKMAKEMWQSAVALCQGWKEHLDGPTPEPTMVLASGYSTVGNFGSTARLEYTAVGGAASEVCALLPLVKPGLLACSQSTWVLIQQQIEGQLSETVQVAHRRNPVKLYQLVTPPLPAAPTPTLGPIAKSFGPEPRDIGELEPGTVLAERYEVVRQLGKGGLGTVYHVRDLKLATDLALKLLHRENRADARALERLYREVKLARLISHPNVARIYNLDEWNGHEVVSMEYIDGQSLAHLLQAGEAIALAKGQDILRQICAGLAAAHLAGIVHLNLKPSNIMQEQDGRVVLLDFGIAKWATQMDTQRTGGTPDYMAPEQLGGGPLDQRTDIYSLGCVAYEMFTAMRPFSSSNPLKVAYKHVHERPPDPLSLRPDLSPRLAAVIVRCLEKEPGERFASVGEILAFLKDA